ncbi:MAG: DegV family protein [Clostridia bacterium]|jgi:DegV family protein with EDD domain|nr:DegV family protein [Clostridia bacterium]
MNSQNKVKIITDTCCSLTKDRLEKMGVDYLQNTFMLEEKLFIGFDAFEESNEQFFENLKNVKNISTGCVNIQDAIDLFEKYAAEGVDVVYIGLSSGLSSSYNNVRLAADEINEKYGKKIWVADSLTGGNGLGKVVQEGVRLANEGKSAEEIFNILDKNGLKIISLFVPGDLIYLCRLGRLNKVVAGIGSLLKLSPIIAADENGKLKVLAKTIGRKKALATLKEYLLKNADLEKEETIFIGHTNQLQEAKELEKFINDNMKNKTVEIDYIDRTMGCHCGPETIAIFASGK